MLSRMSSRGSLISIPLRTSGIGNLVKKDTGSFLCKGIARHWKTKFTREVREVFDYYAGDTPIELGYEQNRLWVSAGNEIDTMIK